MKKLLIVTLLLLTGVAAASENCSTSESQEEVLDARDINTKAPKWLEGATIIVKLKDGSESVVSAEKFKVVPRKQQFIITAVQKRTETMCKNVDKNRVSLHAGKGPKGGLDRDNSMAPAFVEVKSQFGAVGGLQYQYKFDNDFSLSVQGQTNKTGLIGVGYDF